LIGKSASDAAKSRVFDFVIKALSWRDTLPRELLDAL